MTLRLRLRLVVVVVLVGLIATLAVLVWSLLLRDLSALETRALRQDVARVLSTLSASQAGLEALARDWGHWNDTYAFVASGDETLYQENLNAPFFETFDLDLVLIADRTGRLVYAAHAEAAGLGALSPDELRAFGPEHPLWLRDPAAREPRSGLLQLPGGIALVALSPILTSTGEGPSRGSFLVARYLTEARLAAYAQHTLAAVSLAPYEELTALVAADHPGLTQHQLAARTLYSYPRDDATLLGYAALHDLFGRPLAALRVSEPRVFYQQGLVSARALIAAVALVGLSFSALVLVLVERLLLARLGFLSAEVARIAQRGDVSARLDLPGVDELSRLAGDINGMLASLERAFAALRESRERYALAAQGANDGLWDWEAARGVTLSSRCAALLGLPEVEQVRPPWQLIRHVHPDDRQRVLKQLAAQVRGESAHFESELRLRDAEGRYRWMLLRGVAVRAEPSAAPPLAPAGAPSADGGVAHRPQPTRSLRRAHRSPQPHPPHATPRVRPQAAPGGGGRALSRPQPLQSHQRQFGPQGR